MWAQNPLPYSNDAGCSGGPHTEPGGCNGPEFEPYCPEDQAHAKANKTHPGLTTGRCSGQFPFEVRTRRCSFLLVVLVVLVVVLVVLVLF